MEDESANTCLRMYESAPLPCREIYMRLRLRPVLPPGYMISDPRWTESWTRYTCSTRSEVTIEWPICISSPVLIMPAPLVSTCSLTPTNICRTYAVVCAGREYTHAARPHVVKSSNIASSSSLRNGRLSSSVPMMSFRLVIIWWSWNLEHAGELASFHFLRKVSNSKDRGSNLLLQQRPERHLRTADELLHRPVVQHAVLDARVLPAVRALLLVQGNQHLADE